MLIGYFRDASFKGTVIEVGIMTKYHSVCPHVVQKSVGSDSAPTDGALLHSTVGQSKRELVGMGSKWTQLLIILILLLVSDDILFVLEFNGPTIRLSQVLGGVLVGRFLLRSLFTGKLYYPRRLVAIHLLGAFCLSDAVNLLNSPWLLKGFAYLVWAIFNLAFVIALVDFVGRSRERLTWILRWYLYSFTGVAAFGLVQFLAGVFFGESLLTRQWWFQGWLPRINGLSFEPSYFATYMIVGVSLWWNAWRDRWIFVRYHALNFSIVCLAILLSGARAGWIGLALLIICYLCLYMRSRHGKWLRGLAISLFVGAILTCMFYLAIEKWHYLLSGTGITGTSQHSVTERLERAWETFSIFKAKPISGVGLGCVGAAILEKQGVFLGYRTDELWATEPVVLALEILASTGLIGFIFWLTSLLWIVKALINVIRLPFLAAEWRSIVSALLIAFVVEFVLLQINQNFLRYYVWLQIGITLAVINVLKSYIVNGHTYKSFRGCASIR